MTKKWTATLTFLFLTFSFHARAEWEFKNTHWLGKEVYSMFQPSIEKHGGLLVSSDNLDAIRFKIFIDKNTLKLKNDKAPYIVKGILYFDDKKYSELPLQSGLNVHKLDGQEYELEEDMFDVDLYDALKTSQTLKFEYRGKDDQKYSVTVPLENYYEKYNEFVTYRRREFVPAFLSKEKKKQYVKVVNECIQLAEGKVQDLAAKKAGVSLTERQKAVIKAIKQKDKQKDAHYRQQLSDRVASAYEYVADLSHPKWYLYPLFTDCFNRHVAEFN